MAVQQYLGAVGRRKSAIARARIVAGGGQVVVNGRPIDEYFGGPIWTAHAVEPLRTVNQLGQVTVDVRVVGGGRSGQAGATSHAIARALVKSDETLRLPLRRAGLLTRDARVKERKKYGLKRARKAPQYTKR